MFLSKKAYSVAKFITQIALPAVGTLYFALAGIWTLPAAERVLGTIIAIDTFLGVLLGLSSNQYAKSEAKYDGSMNVVTTPEKTVYSLELNADPATLKDKQIITFKVKSS